MKKFMTPTQLSSNQLDLGFSPASGLPFVLSPRKIGMHARRELKAAAQRIETPAVLFRVKIHAERIALLKELQHQYHRAQRYGNHRITRTTAGLRSRRLINALVQKVVSESANLCG